MSTAARVPGRPLERPAAAPVGSRSAAYSPGRPTAPEARTLAARATENEVRVVRRIRPWSVWKLSLAFALCLVAVVTTAAALLWAVAASLGVVDNVEGFVEDMGFDTFTLDGGAMLRALVIIGLIASVAASVMAAVLAVMFNLLSDLTGGIEAVLAPKPSRRGSRRSHERRHSRSRRRVEAPAVQARAEPAPETFEPQDGPVPVAGVEVSGRNGPPVLDLTDDPDVVDSPQLVLDDLLGDPPPHRESR